MSGADAKKPGHLRAGLYIWAKISGSSLWWKWIITVAVAVADTSVFTMDQYFAFLVDRNIACRTSSFRLSTVMRGVALISFPAYGPAAFARDYVLIFTAHFSSFHHGGILVCIVEFGINHLLSKITKSGFSQ